tara:strand:- start:21 stop:224 length:204 start_codon:yes stop_codon:yes gene_type:complete
MVIIVVIVVTTTKFISETQIVSVYVMMKSNTELRYDRLVFELENLERKRDRKIKQILAVRKKLGMTD